MPRSKRHHDVLTLCAIATCALALGCEPRERGPEVQIVGVSTRIRTGDPAPRGSPFFDGRQVALVAARGERIGLQVLHRVSGPVTLDLRAHGVSVASFAVEPAIARRASTAMYGGGRGAGSYPDVLIADAAPDTDPAYFELAVDRAAAAGRHAGALRVGDRRFEVVLEVVDVELPEVPPRVWAYYDPRELVWAGLGTGTHAAPSDEERACIAMFRARGVMLTPDLPLAAWPAREQLLAGFPYVPVKLPREPAAAAHDVAAWIAATAGTGQTPFAIPIDEPRTAEARARVVALATAVRAAGGGPGAFLFAVTDEPRAEYAELIDLYITLRPRRGDERARWTYNGAPPRAGAMVLDARPPGVRTWGWLAHRWEIPVWYLWDALYWHDRHNRAGTPLPGRALDVRVDAISFDDGEDRGNLDGVLALPGDARMPCRPTLRLAAIERGMLDRQLIELAARCDPSAAAAIVEAMVPHGLGDAPPRGTARWPRDEAAWEAARRRLLALAACRRADHSTSTVPTTRLAPI